MATTNRFSSKDPAESVVCTFDFAPSLSTGETLISFVVSISINTGVDASYLTVLSGPAVMDSTATKVLQPVANGVDQVVYEIAVLGTTSSGKVLKLPCLLPVVAM